MSNVTFGGTVVGRTKLVHSATDRFVGADFRPLFTRAGNITVSDGSYNQAVSSPLPSISAYSIPCQEGTFTVGSSPYVYTIPFFRKTVKIEHNYSYIDNDTRCRESTLVTVTFQLGLSHTKGLANDIASNIKRYTEITYSGKVLAIRSVDASESGVSLTAAYHADITSMYECTECDKVFAEYESSHELVGNSSSGCLNIIRATLTLNSTGTWYYRVKTYDNNYFYVDSLIDDGETTTINMSRSYFYTYN